MGIDKLLRTRTSVVSTTWPVVPMKKLTYLLYGFEGHPTLLDRNKSLRLFFLSLVSLSGKRLWRQSCTPDFAPFFQFRHCFIPCMPESRISWLLLRNEYIWLRHPFRIHSCFTNFYKAFTWRSILLISPRISRCFWARTPMQVSPQIAVTFCMLLSREMWDAAHPIATTSAWA